MIRVIIVDDHPVVRRGIAQILVDGDGVKVVGEASDAASALTLVRKTPCDLVLLDISLPGRSGLELLSDIRYEKPRLPVLVLSMHAEDQYAVRALRSGAAGYLTKDRAPEELVVAVKKIAAGGRYISESLADRLACEIAAPSDCAPHELLSDREFQVLRMLGSGMKQTDAARALHLSAKTIGTYRARIFEKLGLRTYAEMVAYCIEKGLLD